MKKDKNNNQDGKGKDIQRSYKKGKTEEFLFQ